MKMRNLLTAAALGLLLGSSSGCGSSAPPATSDPNTARTILNDMMESWKRGDAIDAPTKLSPSVIVVDEDWQASQKLQDYRIEQSGQMVGTSLHCLVTITLPYSKSKVKTKTVTYV